MITVETPSAVLNDSRAAVAYRMDYPHTVQPASSIQAMVNLVVADAAAAPGGKIRNLVLTAHGLPAYFQLGAGLSQPTMNPFGALNGKVYKIWFRGCLVGRIAGPQTASHGDGAALAAYGITTGNGHAFLSAFARLTGCYVVAPTEMQVSAHTSYPLGKMDSYEGLVLCYNPQGNISWQRRYPSLYGYNTVANTATGPNRE